MALGLLLSLGALAGTAASRAQTPPDTVLFEPVGDIPVDANGITFDPEGTLWATGSNTWRLPPGASMWDEVSGQNGNDLVALAADTLVLATGTLLRSSNAGATWEGIYNEGVTVFKTLAGSMHPDLLLAGTYFGHDYSGFAYSPDRGRMWFEAYVSPEGTFWTPQAYAFAEVPAGPHRGRLIGGAVNGVYLSDDGGRTWQASSLFEDGVYLVESVVVGSDGRIWAASGRTVYESSDDGATWLLAATFPYPVLLAATPAPPEGDGALYAQLQYGEDETLYRSYDGETWTVVGRIFSELVVRSVKDIEVGPDGRLYVAVVQAGPEREYVYRTTEPVVVANEPEALPLPETALHVYPNPARKRLTLTGPSGTEAVVYDVLGRVVRRARLASGTVEVDVAGLAPGVYVVRAGSQSAVVTVRR